MDCNNCNNGKMKAVVIDDYMATINRISFPVKNANIYKCSSCGAECYTAKELKRWERIQISHLSEKGFIPNPEQIRQLRIDLDVNISEFASLLGVTRQTIHAWENGIHLSFGPACLLLLLLREERRIGSSFVISYLMKVRKEEK